MSQAQTVDSAFDALNPPRFAYRAFYEMPIEGGARYIFAKGLDAQTMRDALAEMRQHKGARLQCRALNSTEWKDS